MQLVQALKFEHLIDKGPAAYNSSLLLFLIDRAIHNEVLGNYLHWYLMVECSDKELGKMYGKVVYHYYSAILQVCVLMHRAAMIFNHNRTAKKNVPNGRQRRETLRLQGEFVNHLNRISKEIRSMKGSRQQKREKLRNLLKDQKTMLPRALPLPLEPTKQICGIAAGAYQYITNATHAPFMLIYIYLQKSRPFSTATCNP